MSEYRFPKSMRLLTKSEFDRVFDGRASAADSTLVVYVCEAAAGHSRLGLVVSRKVGNAVTRNRWKRVIREAFRLAQGEIPAGDYVCLPRGGVTPDLDSVSKSLESLARRAVGKLQRGQNKPPKQS